MCGIAQSSLRIAFHIDIVLLGTQAMKVVLEGHHRHATIPHGRTPDLATLADQQIAGLEALVDQLAGRDRHFVDLGENDLVPQDVRCAQKRYPTNNEAKLALFDDFWMATQDDERLWASD